jgi:hypothetical protein
MDPSAFAATWKRGASMAQDEIIALVFFTPA